MSDHALGIDDEQAAQGDAGRLIENLIGRSDLLFQIRHQGVSDIAKTTIFAIGLNPGQVAELAVNGNTKNLGVAAGEISVAIAECRDLGGADEGEIEGIEEKHHVLAAVVGKADLLKLLIHNGRGRELGSRQTDEPGHGEGDGSDLRKVRDPSAGLEQRGPRGKGEVGPTTSYLLYNLSQFQAVPMAGGWLGLGAIG